MLHYILYNTMYFSVKYELFCVKALFIPMMLHKCIIASVILLLMTEEVWKGIVIVRFQRNTVISGTREHSLCNAPCWNSTREVLILNQTCRYAQHKQRNLRTTLKNKPITYQYKQFDCRVCSCNSYHQRSQIKCCYKFEGFHLTSGHHILGSKQFYLQTAGYGSGE